MKTFVTIPKIILALCILIPTISNAQKVELNKEFSFDENSKTESFTFKVEKGTKKLSIDLEGIISKGGLKVKILDPDGKQISGFSLLSSKSVSISVIDTDDDSKKHVASSPDAESSANASASAKSKSSENASVSVSARSSSRSSSSSSSNSNSVSVAVNSSGESDTHNTHIYTKEKTETNDAGARGVINKEITNPTEGTWKFTIYPDDTTGHLTAKISYK